MKYLIDLILSVAFCIFNWAYGKAGIQNRKRSRKRKRNPNPNLRNKNWRRFCPESVTNNNCSVKTCHLHIIFIYWYYIFSVASFAYGAKFFFQNFIYAWALQVGIMIDMSTPDWHDWHEYSSSLCRLSLTMDKTWCPFNKGTSKKIKVFILFRFTEFQKCYHFTKTYLFSFATKRRIDWNVSTCENVKLLCLEFMLESAAEQHGLILWILVVMFFFL